MHAYRFRMLHEDQEEFLRDFDILSSHTFADFHNLIRQSVELPGNELASFFVCDRNWRKKKEVTLINMKDDAHEPEEDDDDRRSPRQTRIPVCEMDKVKVKDIIDDPHQRLLYEYDFLNPKVFFVELMRILEADSKTAYPLCVKSTGAFITAVSPVAEPELNGEEDEVALLSEFDDILNNEDDDMDVPIFDADTKF
ncbi:MAG: hypothetical protein CVT94_18150 [Bacteroidetes bacterium HGW-Bacteroidetes-11]|nr:MAG: hypothetical protein CVT94_18150 [Bacteroidetes bacterium HGW-Bacteroidetes-11]